MIYPSIDKLLNVVDSKYRLVHLAALRSDDIRENNNLQKNEEDYVSKKKRQTVDTSNSLFDNSCFETIAVNEAHRVEFQVLEEV